MIKNTQDILNNPKYGSSKFTSIYKEQLEQDGYCLLPPDNSYWEWIGAGPEKIRKIWPKNRILGARINGKDWLKNGSSISDCIYLCKKLKMIGFDYVCITSGGIISKTRINFKKGYQVFLAKKIKEKVQIKVKTTGMISGLTHAEKIITTQQADLVSFGRKFINSPTWLVKEMISKNKKIKLPNQYKRCF